MISAFPLSVWVSARQTVRILAHLGMLLFLFCGALPAFAQQGQSQPPTIANELLNSTADAYGARDFDRALLDISLFILLNPTSSQGYYIRGLIQIARDEADDALANLESAIALSEDDIFGVEYRAALLTTQAGILQSTGDSEGALAAYERALDAAPNIDAYRGRAVLRLQQQDFDAALEDIDAALALNDESQEAGLYLFRASVLTLQGDADAAAVDYFNYASTIASDVRQSDPLASDQARDVEMAAGRIYAIPFMAAEGDRLTAAAAAPEANTVDPLLILIALDGTPLAANDDRGPNDFRSLISDFPLPGAGTYILLLTHAGGANTGIVRVGISLGS